MRGEIEVTLDGDALRIKYGSSFAGRLEHWHYNTFRARWESTWRVPPLVNFTLNPAGQPGVLEMSGGRFVRR